MLPVAFHPVKPGQKRRVRGNPLSGRLGRENGVFIGGFGIELLLDLAHLGQPHHPTEPGRIDAILSRQPEQTEDRQSGGHGAKRRPYEPARGCFDAMYMAGGVCVFKGLVGHMSNLPPLTRLQNSR